MILFHLVLAAFLAISLRLSAGTFDARTCPPLSPRATAAGLFSGFAGSAGLSTRVSPVTPSTRAMANCMGSGIRAFRAGLLTPIGYHGQGRGTSSRPTFGVPIRHLLALAMLCGSASAFAAPVPKELRRPPVVERKEVIEADRYFPSVIVGFIPKAGVEAEKYEENQRALKELLRQATRSRCLPQGHRGAPRSRSQKP